MRQFLVATSLASIVSISLMCGPLGAKPADLPANDKVKCPDGQEKGEHGGIAIDLDALSGRFEEPHELDVTNPVILEAWFGQWLDALAQLLTDAADPREQQARQAYEAADRARRAGDLATARTGFQQVHFLAPTTRLGRLAIDRIIEIEQRLRATDEEAEPTPPSPAPLPESRGSEDDYEPLGRVELTY